MAVRIVKSAERTMALFELFSARATGLRVSDVGRELGMPQPSVSMLLRSFVELGYLEYDPKKRVFQPTVRVMLLGAWIADRFSKEGSIAKRLAVLQRKVGGETVYVAIQHSANIQYVLSMEAKHADRLSVGSGQYRTITCSASGRVLLSLKPDDEVRRWVRRANAEATDEHHKVREQEFLEILSTIREKGYASTSGISSPNIAATAVAVPSPLGGMPLAIGAGGPRQQIEKRRDLIVESLLELREEFLNETG
jgi:DNA-binding IclR family transcriptional regulator